MKPTDQQIRYRITRHLKTVPDVPREEGENWYPLAIHEVRGIAHACRLSPATIADVVSILSPANLWGSNLQQAHALSFAHTYEPEQVERLTFTTYKANVTKAIQRLKGHPVLSGGEKTAPKTYRFARNLQGDFRPVTIDRWVLRAIGWPTDSVSYGDYVRIERIIQEYADSRTDYAPAVLQAVLWKSVQYRQGVR